MWGIAVNILSELILIIVVTAFVLFTNRAELLKRLGYKKIYMDIPYDRENNIVLLVKARIHDYRSGIYVLPQTSKIRTYREDSSIINAEELGLGRNLYNPKLPLKYTGKSNEAKKSYQLCYVKVSKNELIQAAKEKDIPWKYDEKKDSFAIKSVEYEEALFASPENALDILIKNSLLGTRPNPERSDVYKKGFEMLGKLFKLDIEVQS